MNTDQRKIIQQILDINKELEERKALYDLYDKLLIELKDSGFKDGNLGGLSLSLKDNFLDKEGNEKNTGYRIAFIKRYELNIKKKKGA